METRTEEKMAKVSSHFSMGVILGHLEVAGRRIVAPWAPT